MSAELVVLRGPLPEPLRAQVRRGWGRYDERLLDDEEWADEFERGPEGPAVHALVVQSEDEVLGHHCAIPVRLREGGRAVVAAKGEALYVERAAARAPRVRFQGEDVRPVEALTRGLYAAYARFGLAAYFGYATPQAERRHVAAGCAVAVVPYRRFLYFAEPPAAIALGGARRGAGAIRAALRAHRTLVRLGLRHGGGSVVAHEVDAFDPSLDGARRSALDPSLLALDPAADQLNWRFPSALYRLLELGDSPTGYAVVTRGGADNRQRVVDWLLPGDPVATAPALARALVGSPDRSVDWVVPVNSTPGRLLAGALAGSVLLRDARRRSHRMVVHGGKRFTDAERWYLTLSTQERF